VTPVVHQRFTSAHDLGARRGLCEVYAVHCSLLLILFSVQIGLRDQPLRDRSLAAHLGKPSVFLEAQLSVALVD
jgi:hypothetical protein